MVPEAKRNRKNERLERVQPTFFVKGKSMLYSNVLPTTSS